LDKKPFQLTIQMAKGGKNRLKAGSMRCKEAVTEALKAAIDGSGMDRDAIAAELSRLVGEHVSVHAVNNWCASGKENRRFPLEYVAALAVVTGTAAVVSVALDAAGILVLDKDQAAYYELGLIVAEERQRGRKKRAVMEQLERMA
jgi:hypothetical protein